MRSMLVEPVPTWRSVTKWSSRNTTGFDDDVHMNTTREHLDEAAQPGNVCASCGESFRFIVAGLRDLCGPCALLTQVFAGTLFKPTAGAKLFEPIKWDNA